MRSGSVDKSPPADRPTLRRSPAGCRHLPDPVPVPVKPDCATRTVGRRTGPPGIRSHGRRHEHVSSWNENGGSLDRLPKRLGHSSILVTSKVYTHQIGEAERVAAEAVSALIPRVPQPSCAPSVHHSGFEADSEANEEAPEPASPA
ncbi:tyrosine-type recombinase/integrase [Pseudoclavibacter caeni]|uniref:Tyrosine-type recombinase/integrase n=1 Tax=Pseudoclavibacter caeni TaxID=908846 RepID=A0A7C8FU68_9MICO|nr:tyrosine-type recombinase/integrase [Pseudoclavibacter caeni]